MTKFMKTSILVQNIACSGCANTIITKLSTLENISNLQVDVQGGKVSFDYLSEGDVLLIKEQLKTLGYPSIADNNTFLSN